MSSSDQGRGVPRYFGGVLAGFAGASLLLAAAMLVVDPLGATGGNGLCPAGAKVVDARTTRTLIAAQLRPRTVVLGTSRVRTGFSQQALARLGPAPVANLGTSAALPADFAALATDSLAGGRLERAFIGIDFNTLHQDNYTAAEQPLAEARIAALERWRRAFVSYEALTALPPAMAGCRPQLRADGTPIVAAPDEADRAAPESAGARVGRQLRKAEWDWARFAARLAELRPAIAALRRRHVDIVLFSAPYQENLVGLFGDLGRAREFDRFHAEVARFAREEGIAFIDLHSPAAIRDLGLPPCPVGGIACHYLDLTHYSPLVGEKVARKLATEARPRPGPRPRP
jgi:hypothetical protein